MLRASDNAVVFAERILGITPHADQIPFLLDAHPIRVLIAGRQGGKSTCSACDAAYQAVTASVRGRACHILLTAPTTDQGRICLDIVERLVRRSPVGGLITRCIASPFPVLELQGGVTVSVRPTAEGGRHLRGHTYSAAYVDEAGWIQHSTVMEAIMPTLAKEGGRLTLTSTPTVRGGWLHDLFERGRRDDPQVRSFAFATRANPHISAQFVEAQRAQMTDQQFAREFEGSFADATCTVFGFDHVAACAVGEEEEPRGDGQYVLGWDPAARRDKSAVVILDKSTKPWSVVKLGDLKGLEYLAQVATIASLARRYNRARIVVDATCQTVLADLLRREGDLSVDAVVFTSETKASLVMNLALVVERREIRFPPRRDLLDEFARYQAQTNPTTGHVRFGAVGAGTFDDMITALALAAKGAGATTTPRSFASEGLPPWLTSSSTTFSSGARVVPAGGLPEEWEAF